MTKRKILSMVLVLTLAVSLMAGCGAKSAKTEPAKNNWPQSPVRIVVPAKAGGMMDMQTRFVTQKWEKEMGGTTAIENFDNSIVAYQKLIDSKPDGLTLMFQSNAPIVSYYTGVFKFNPAEEMTCIASLQRIGDNVIIANPKAPYNNMTEMIEYAKKHPGTLTTGVTINGITHLITGAIEQKAGVTFKVVEATNQTDKITAIAGGFMDFAVCDQRAAKQYEDAGKIKVLGLLSSDGKPSPDNPKWVPVQEQGLDVSWPANVYVLGPKGMDPELVKKINESFKNVESDPEVIKNLKSAGSEAMWNNVADSQAMFKKDMESVAKITTGLGINKVAK